MLFRQAYGMMPAMKSRFFSLLLSLLAGSVVCSADASVEVGRVMCVGDSITHGSFAPSYRWPLHKIFVDNGVKFEFVGVNVGNQPQKYGVTPGIVYAGVGNGNIHKNVFPELENARKKGVIVVRSSRVPTGATTLDAEVDDNKYQFVASWGLNPQKARILLMLALTKTNDWQKIQAYFNEY